MKPASARVILVRLVLPASSPVIPAPPDSSSPMPGRPRVRPARPAPARRRLARVHARPARPDTHNRMSAPRSASPAPPERLHHLRGPQPARPVWEGPINLRPVPRLAWRAIATTRTQLRRTRAMPCRARVNSMPSLARVILVRSVPPASSPVIPAPPDSSSPMPERPRVHPARPALAGRRLARVHARRARRGPFSRRPAPLRVCLARPVRLPPGPDRPRVPPARRDAISHRPAQAHV